MIKALLDLPSRDTVTGLQELSRDHIGPTDLGQEGLQGLKGREDCYFSFPKQKGWLMLELGDIAWTVLASISQSSFFPLIDAEKTKPLWAGTLQPLFITKEVKFWILGFGDVLF